MLYLKENISDTTLLGVWKIEESKEDLLALLEQHDWIEHISAVKSASHILEILAVRTLLKELLGEEKQISYFDSGRPYLADKSYHISISHTKGYVAVALDKAQAVGIDIEHISEKIRRVQSRIISSDEYIDMKQELVHLLLHWCAKESMFKYLDVEGVDFLKHLHVKPFSPVGRGVFDAVENRTSLKQHFVARYIVDNDFVLVCLKRGEF